MPNRRAHVRSSAACVLCRQKKLRCDSVRPTCGNCAAKGVYCETVPLQHKPRPTNRKISSLESENELLRQRCAQLASGSSAVEPSNTLQGHLHASTALSSSPARRPDSTTPAKNTVQTEASDGAHVNTGPLYHGPTSTYYDTPESPQQESPQAIPSSDEASQSFLFAQTARQRQLELLNIEANRLDFDGVEPALGMELLSIYWSRQLYTAQIVYRPVFMRDMACGGPYFSKLLLNAIYFGASKHCRRPEILADPNDMSTTGLRFRRRFSDLLRSSFDKSEITTIQALLIVSNGLFSSYDERSLSWLYAGNAFNMIIDLGLHVQPLNSEVPPEALEVRRRVVWGAYFIDKVQCLLQGRPPLLRQADFKTPLKILDKYDELDMFNGIGYIPLGGPPPMPCLNVTLLTKLCELSTIIETIMVDLYAESNRDTRPSQNMNVLQRIQADLFEWRRSLPPEVDYLTSGRKDAVMLPQSLTLLALYNALIILAQRPLITDTYCSASLAHESMTTSTAAANQILRIVHDYSSRYSIGSSPYLLSYSTYISATIHALVVAQKGQESSSSQSLAFCMSVLRDQLPLYAAAGKAQENLGKLMMHLGISADDGVKPDSSDGQTPGQKAADAPDMISAQVGVADGTELRDVGADFDSFPQSSWEFSDLDMDALSQLFFGDRDLQSLMHPMG